MTDNLQPLKFLEAQDAFCILLSLLSGFLQRFRWIVALYNLTHIVGSVDASVQQDLHPALQIIYYVLVVLWLTSLIRVLCTRLGPLSSSAILAAHTLGISRHVLGPIL